MSKVLLFGGRQKSKLIDNMLHKSNFPPSVIYDDKLESLEFITKSLFINTKEQLKEALQECSKFVVCIGSPKIRYFVSKQLESYGLEPLSVIDSNSLIDKDSTIDKGAQIMQGANVRTYANIGEYCILNSSSCVDHDCDVGNGVHIMGSASLAGNVKAGDFATIGTNSTILPNVTIGKESYVGAGAVVNKDVPDNHVVVGVPARFLRKNFEDFDKNILNFF